MTAKRFKEEMGIAKFIDNQTGKEYSEYNLDEIVGLLNELHEENKQLKQQLQSILELTKKIEECTHDMKLIGDYE